jgi:hypothetical protein
MSKPNAAYLSPLSLSLRLQPPPPPVPWPPEKNVLQKSNDRGHVNRPLDYYIVVQQYLGAVDRSAVGLIFATRHNYCGCPTNATAAGTRGLSSGKGGEGTGDKRSVYLGEAGAGGVVGVNIPHGGHLHHTHPRPRGGRYRRGHGPANAGSRGGGDWERGHKRGSQFHAVQARVVGYFFLFGHFLINI